MIEQRLREEMITPRSVKFKKLRVFLVLLLLFGGLAGVVARLFFVQVLDYRRYVDYSKNQYYQRITISATRGRILDRNLVPLAITVPMKSVFAAPPLVEEKRAASALLARDLGMEEKEVLSRLEKRGHFAWLKRKVGEEEFEAVRARHLKGISFLPEDKRFYPQKFLASRIVGFCGVDNNGLAGLEYLYDKTLAGEQRTIIAQRDAMGKIYGLNGEEAPGGNYELVTTIDSNIQYVAEKALRNVAARFRPKSSIAIVMENSTGDLLAVAETPELDPNDPANFQQSRLRPLAVTQSYEPGSTFKVFIAAAAMEAGVASPDEVFDCENGRYTLYDKTFKEAENKKFGQMQLREIIARSSNIGMIKVSQKLEKKQWYEYLRRFGFGEKTGIDLPGEVGGSLRDYHSWSAVSMPTISFGQEVNVTPIQLASGLAMIGNRGIAVRPHLLKEVLKEGRVVMAYAPPPKDRVISAGTARRVVEMMRYTVLHGTGKLAQVPGYQIAGKTGTAQKFDPVHGGYLPDKVLSSFIALFPAQDPAYSVLVMVDEPLGAGWGGEVAAPAAREIIAGIARYMGIPAEGQRRYEADWKEIRQALSPEGKRAVSTVRMADAGALDEGEPL